MKNGGERRSHTAKCRDRMLKAMGADEEGREKMRKREEEINEKLAREVEQSAKEESKKEEGEGGAKGGRVPTMVGNPHQPHRQVRGIRQKRQTMRVSG